MTHAPAGPFARLPAPIPEAEVEAEAHRLFVKQATEEPHGYMMGPWDKVSVPVRDTWKSLARRRLTWRKENEH